MFVPLCGDKTKGFKRRIREPDSPKLYYNGKIYDFHRKLPKADAINILLANRSDCGNETKAESEAET